MMTDLDAKVRMYELAWEINRVQSNYSVVKIAADAAELYGSMQHMAGPTDKPANQTNQAPKHTGAQHKK